MAKTRAQLRDAARQLSDTVNSGNPTDPEVNDRINEAISDAYDIVISCGQHYYQSQLDFTLAGGQSGFVRALPADFDQDQGLDKDPGTSHQRRIPLGGSFQERNRMGLAYFIDGQNLSVRPPEQAAGNYRLYYTPIAPSLGADGTSLDAVMSLMDLYIETHVAVAIKHKRDQDAGPLEQKLGQLKLRARGKLTRRTEEAKQAPLVDRVAPWWRDPGDMY